jgi:predicted RNA-binding Zn ribbon-like protein
VQFTSYTDKPVEMATELVNTLHYVSGDDNLTQLEELEKFRAKYSEEQTNLKPEDLNEIRYLRTELRKVFVSKDEIEAATVLNQILQHFGATVRISWHSQPLHLHFEAIEAGFARWLGAATAMGLTVVLCDYGRERLGICASDTCHKAFVDVSRNNRKIYCSENCAHRESVAAYRSRLRSNN